MADEIKRKFERGDFLTKKNKKGSFMIYEGNNLSDSTYKKMSLICMYDPEKYVMGQVGYEQKPHLEVGEKNKPCSETIDTEEEDFWIEICSDAQKEEAMNILAKYGFYWNADTLELINIETGEIVRKVVIPDNKYYGQVIHPIGNDIKNILKKYCLNKNKTISYGYDGYNDYYD